MRGVRVKTGARRMLGAFWGGLALAASGAFAAGTPAGTVISNSATVEFTLDGSSQVRKSNVNTLRVDDKVSFTLTAADTSDVSVTPGGRGFLTFVLTNTGNAGHDFTLQAVAAAGATLVPASGPTFHADASGSAPLPADANAANLPYLGSLAPDASRTVFLYLTAPQQVADGDAVRYQVTAEAYQQGHLGALNPPVKASTQAAAGAAADKRADPMTAFVVLADGRGSGGDQERDGRYAVVARDGAGGAVGFKARSAGVNIVKSATVTDRSGGSQPVSGATVSYLLRVTVTGSGSALGAVLSDPIPANTTYRPGTLKLNGTLLTDAVDGDAGDVGASVPGSVTVLLGDLNDRSPVQTVSFDVEID
ncbi:MAG TPA: hypothetical protein DCZ75_09755 [Geobacter sp.]|nr:hypothetical protein [Geobacter sp.]